MLNWFGGSKRVGASSAHVGAKHDNWIQLEMILMYFDVGCGSIGWVPVPASFSSWICKLASSLLPQGTQHQTTFDDAQLAFLMCSPAFLGPDSETHETQTTSNQSVSQPFYKVTPKNKAGRRPSPNPLTSPAVPKAPSG